MNKLPTLYHKGKNGELWSKKIWTEGADVVSEHGLIDGKKQITRITCTPKNVGKKNATTAEQQAELEAKAKHKYDLDRQYSLTPEKAQEPSLLPMLAQDFEKRKHKNVIYPGSIQPKLDGVRCLSRWKGKSIELISRNGKTYNCPHIVKELSQLLPKDIVVDGELYVHAVGFQTITSWVKKLQSNTNKIEYHLYDVPEHNGIDDAKWEIRCKQLNALKTHIEFLKLKHIKIVPTYIVGNEREVKRYQMHFVEDGYEGAIFRNLEGKYQYDYRSYDLLKVKSFDENEFPIIGFTKEVKHDEETGKKYDLIIWICRSDNEETFNVRPKGTIEEREEFYKNAKSYVGRMLTVKYFGLTDEKIPRFPVGLGFKEDR